MAQQQGKRLQSVITVAVIVVLVILYFIFGRKEDIDKREKGFRHNKIEYSDHAKCRIDCLHLTEKDIKEVLKEGEINYKETEKNASPCPRFAVEYYSNGKAIRVVVGDCDDKAVIITVMELEKKIECYCPGDEEKK